MEFDSIFWAFLEYLNFKKGEGSSDIRSLNLKKEDFAFIMTSQLVVTMSPHVPPVPPVLHFLENEDENFLLIWFSRVQTKEDFFRQKMGLTIFNIDLTNLKIPLQTSFYIFERLRIS